MEVFRRRFEKAAVASETDLAARARELAARYDLPEPADIRWVSNQAHRWGSCTPSTGTVRLSDRMVGYPPWVVDAVIVHELAHLVEPGHGSAFQALMARYPLAERAEGYLLAKSDGDAPDADALAGDEPEDEPTDRGPELPGDGRLFS